MQEIELLENEEILRTIKGDYWLNTLLFLYEQRNGEIVITNMRILFNSKVFTKTFLELALTISDIESIEKCNVGSIIPINPTGVKITLKNGRKFKLSSYHRKDIIEELENLMN